MDSSTFVAKDLGYGPNLFYYLRHDPSLGNFSTFGTISTSGAITDRFGVGQNFDDLVFVEDNLGYGPNLFYFLRHDPSLGNFSTFGTISTSGAVTDRFGVGLNFDALTFAVGAPTPTPTFTPTNTPTNTPTSTPTPVAVVPTLNEWGMLLFGLLIAAAGLLLVRRR